MLTNIIFLDFEIVIYTRRKRKNLEELEKLGGVYNPDLQTSLPEKYQIYNPDEETDRLHVH